MIGIFFIIEGRKMVGMKTKMPQSNFMRLSEIYCVHQLMRYTIYSLVVPYVGWQLA